MRKTLDHKDDHSLNRKWITLLILPRNQTQNLKIQGREIIKVNVTTAFVTLTLRRLMSYIYGAPILDVSRSHTTTQHSR